MKTMKLERRIKLDDSWDVIVAGGGPSGCTAAIAAARGGARTLLIEATGALGGMGTMGLVPAWCPFSDGEKIIYRGLAQKVFEASKAGMPHIRMDALNWVPIDPEHLKTVYDDLVLKAGVKVLFNTSLTAVEPPVAGVVREIIVSNKSGLTAFKAKVYVDATGDADLAAWAGAPFRKGDASGEVQPSTHCFSFSNVDTYAYLHGGRPDAELGRTIAGSGKYPGLAGAHLCCGLTGPGTVGFNAGHIWGVDNTDPASVTAALIRGRKMAGDFRKALQENLPQTFGNAFIAATAALMGVRETRRIIGDYVLTLEDYLARRSFEDEICRNSYPVDVHTARKEIAAHDRGEMNVMNRYENFGKGESHGIPFRCLIPEKLGNVLVAGRSISTDREVQGSTRVMPVCLCMGEAAGVAAAMALKCGGDVRRIRVDVLRARLKKHGAYLP